jgi:HEAT repeat protein
MTWRTMFCLALIAATACRRDPDPKDQLRSDDEFVRAEGLFTLRKTRDRSAVGLLIDVMLHDPKVTNRGEAATALGAIGDRRAHVPLLAVANDPNEDALVTWPALRALAQSQDATLIPALIDIWRRGKSSIHEGVLDVLSTDLRDLAFEPLVLALKDCNPNVRKFAVRTLGEIGDPRAVEPITALVDDPEVSGWAEQVLDELRD